MNHTFVAAFFAGLTLAGTAFTALGATHYVNIGNAAPVAPFTDWTTAANNIQDALDAATAGDIILVTNGLYGAGSRVVSGSLPNRVAVTQPVTVRSVNGPGVTIIQGAQAPGITNGDGAVRCVWLTNGAVLAGFTLTNGATLATGDEYLDQSGGGVWGVSWACTVSNCVLAGNCACNYGGGACSNTLVNCTLTGNSAWTLGGGAYSGVLNNCALTGNVASGGGGVINGTLSNCVLSANLARNGGGASAATLYNCTLTGNAGNGAMNSALLDCVLAGNAGVDYGAGAYSCTLTNCALTGNAASLDGGGAIFSTLVNCTVTGNSASRSAGGVASSTLYNCLVYYNTASDGNYAEYSSFNYCCTTPLPPDGAGNLAAEPQLAGAWHLSAASPCRGAGNTAYASGLDLDGETWANPPSIGCDEYWSGAVTGAVSVTIVASVTNVAAGFPVNFQAAIAGRVSASSWDFGDGTVVSNRPYATHSWAGVGIYPVLLRAYNESSPAGVAATLWVQVGNVPVHYVALDNSSPAAPYTSWATAANNIQDAVDAATENGALILVSDGVYQTGARAVYGMSNRLAVTKPVTVRSVNGPAATVIAGCQAPSATNGPTAVRCAYLTNGAVLAGFTLTNGATQASGDENRQQSGGGVYCESVGAQLTNCVLIGNAAAQHGGGACLGTLDHCVLIGNASFQDGGGASGGTLNNCGLTNNSAVFGGAGESCTFSNCTLAGNVAGFYGGGTEFGTLNNCVLAGNSAGNAGGGGLLRDREQLRADGQFRSQRRRGRIQHSQELHPHRQHRLGLRWRRPRLHPVQLHRLLQHGLGWQL